MGAIKMIVKQDELSIIKFDGIKVRIITYLVNRGLLLTMCVWR